MNLKRAYKKNYKIKKLTITVIYSSKITNKYILA